MVSEDVKFYVDNLITSKPVVVFSKTNCESRSPHFLSLVFSWGKNHLPLTWTKENVFVTYLFVSFLDVFTGPCSIKVKKVRMREREDEWLILIISCTWLDLTHASFSRFSWCIVIFFSQLFLFFSLSLLDSISKYRWFIQTGNHWDREETRLQWDPELHEGNHRSQFCPQSLHWRPMYRRRRWHWSLG